MKFSNGEYDNYQTISMTFGPSGSAGMSFLKGTSPNSTTVTITNSTGAIRCVSLTQTSDENAKHDIKALNLDQSSSFIYSLTPYEFRYNDFNDRLHHGLTTGNVEKSINKIFGYSDWGIVSEPSRDDYENGAMYKSLAYNELIADIIATLQSQNKRLKALENGI